MPVEMDKGPGIHRDKEDSQTPKLANQNVPDGEESASIVVTTDALRVDEEVEEINEVKPKKVTILTQEANSTSESKS